jgi:hypothetical protein
MLKPIFLPSSSAGGDMTATSTTPSFSADNRAAAEPNATTLMSLFRIDA